MKGDAPPPLFSQQKQQAPRDISVNKYLVSQKVPEDQSGDELISHTHAVGQIESIQLPLGWTPGYGLNNVVGNSCYTEFLPSGSSGQYSESRIEFFYRGTQVPENEASAFRKILSSGHVLTEEEYESLGSILRGKDRGSVFQVDLAWTARHNEKPVLMIEGTYVEDGKRTLIVLINAGNNGAVVQEVALVAPEKSYAEMKPEMEQALQSLRWI